MAADRGDWDEAVLQYMEAVEQDPDNLTYRAALMRTKIRASQEHFEKGKRFRDAGVKERALVEFQQAVQLDPTNQYAQVELEGLLQEITDEQRAAAGETIDELKERTRGARPQPPVLNPRSNEPIDLDFPEPTSIKDIYRALGQAFGINVLFDPALKDQEITITLREVTAQDALEVLIRSAGHFYKVQDEHTIIIVADTPQNRRNYEDLVIQTFFLSNADIKQVMTMLRSLVDAKKIATNEQLNAIVLRDTADKVKVAERIIESNDKAKAEVVIDVELLQVNTGRMRNLGVLLDSYSVTQSLDLGGDDVPLRLSDIDDLTSNNWALTIPNFIYNFVKSNTEAQLLAKPQLRISEGEKATLLIGERVPVPTTTFNTSNTVGGNIVPLTTFQYTDVGIQIELEPRVHHNKEITLKVKVEVSNISNFVEGTGGQRQPVIGTRRIESTIRLKDGETNFLAGLIRTEDIDTESGIPGLSDIPLIGRLFTNSNRDHTRTDVVMTMTPHIIRTPNLTENDLLPIWVGTESNITFRGGSPRVEADIDGPFERPDQRERVQQLLRERLQRLPRGLRDDAEGAPDEENTPGVELAPSGLPPSSLFEEDEDEEEPNDSSSLQIPEYLERPATLPGGAAGGVLGTAAAVALGSSETPSPVRLSLAPGTPSATIGEIFTVQLRAETERPVAHVPLTVRFDGALLEVVRVTGGDFLGGDGETVVLADHSQPGRIVLGASRLGQRGGVAGDGVVAEIQFRALNAGEATLSLENARVRDAGLQTMPVAVQGSRLTLLPARAGEAGPRIQRGED
jgi:general secretion pathway protein D